VTEFDTPAAGTIARGLAAPLSWINRLMLEYRNEPANRESGMRRSIGLIFLAVLVLCPERVWALANPASVFCAQSGGKSEIRKGPRGQYGVCRLPDGRVVDEWAYFRKMKGQSAPAR
jgi:putative hemolysin